MITGSDIARFRRDLGRDDANSAPTSIDFFGCKANRGKTDKPESEHESNVSNAASVKSKRKYGEIQETNDVIAGGVSEENDDGKSEDDDFVGFFANSKKPTETSRAGDRANSGTAKPTKIQSAHSEQAIHL